MSYRMLNVGYSFQTSSSVCLHISGRTEAWIILDPNSFRMSRCPAADLLVGGLSLVAICVPDFRL